MPETIHSPVTLDQQPEDPSYKAWSNEAGLASILDPGGMHTQTTGEVGSTEQPVSVPGRTSEFYSDDDWDSDPNYGVPSTSHQEVSKPFAPEAPLTERPGEYVELAPDFSKMAKDTTRTNLITYVSGVRDGLSGMTENTGYNETTVTESQALHELHQFLEDVATSSKSDLVDRSVGWQAEAMSQDLTFIGKREYDEATGAFATSLRERLMADPALQVCLFAGGIDADIVKSDSYMLDNILKHFTDEEVAVFHDRIVFSPDNLTAPPDHVAIDLLDDLVMSGGQMSFVAEKIREAYPQYSQVIELNLIAASEKLLQKGLLVGRKGQGMGQAYVPVKAYYKAHHSNNGYGARITGAHCAVDYGFNDEIAMLSQQLGRDMPPATNIVRPYRSGRPLVQIDRFRSAGARTSAT